MLNGALAIDRLREVGRNLDNLLVAHHGLKAALAEDHLPLTATYTEAVERYGNTPLLHLWNECRLVEALRIAWVDGFGEPKREGIGS